MENNEGSATRSGDENMSLEDLGKNQGFLVKSSKKKPLRFDPFEKVILVKGIDNSILTSFRTLKKENNVISDTMKVIHNKFQPMIHGKSSSYFFSAMSKCLAEKNLYPLTDNEEALDFASLKL